MGQIIPPLILGVVQGVSEFLPISSSGHLIVIPQIFGWHGVVDSLSFDVALHVGTTIAVVGFFWRDWLDIFRHFFSRLLSGWDAVFADPESRLLPLIIVGSIPATVVGLAFKDFIESSVRSSMLVGINLIIFGLVLWFFDRYEHKRKIEDAGWKDALFVGIAQAISLLPGVSRSGITITAARSQKIDRQAAVRFSFLLSTPAIVGAAILTFEDLPGSGMPGNFNFFVVGFVAAAISGWLTIKFLVDFVKNRGFGVFVGYRIVFGIFLILWSLFF